MKYTAIINGKTIAAQTFAQLKRKASTEANKNYNIEDTFFLLCLPGVDPLVFRRRNKKAPDNTITRGKWQ